MVPEMFSLGGAVGEAWVWRRLLRAWEEEMLSECQTLLLTVSLQDHSSDCWQWQPELDSGYTVCGAYQLLTDRVVAPLDAAAGLIWHPQVPLRCPFWRGDSCVIGYPLNQTLSLEVFYQWRRGGVSTSLVSLLQHFWLPLAFGQFMGRFFFGDSADSSRPFRPVY
ncbi:hypothetical protein TSUD_242550 [Trifolium subterraneum]|uniref:Uncharacterized protein n=1 Tax=Trifolium subterraneum TaxID=3900 RepID=A0A2Z6LWK5_TRISU|nr:hypothetical protein TSUD_242550 [Trifolium subterraneum]